VPGLFDFLEAYDHDGLADGAWQAVIEDGVKAYNAEFGHRVDPFEGFMAYVEAASVAWNPLGWHAVAFSEIEPFPCAVLDHHYPDIPNLGDMTKFKDWPNVSIDLLCGGTPCQSFSVAGLRKGLDDPRGDLMLTFGAIAGRYRPRWLVWENVPGVLSSNEGRDFGSFLGMLGQLGYGFAYRVLDAQYFGVAQRRRRVFVVGYLGDWRRAAAVLFERHSLSRDPAPRRETGKGFAADIAPSLVSSGRGVERCGDPRGQDPVIAHTLSGEGFDASEDGTGRGTPLVPIAFDTTQITSAANYSNPRPGDSCHPLAAGAHAPAIAFDCKSSGQNDFGIGIEVAGTQRAMTHSNSHSNGGGHQAVATLAIRGRDGEPDLEVRHDGTANALLTPNEGRAGIGVGAVHYGMQVRRLTPTECERLQGFPDGYTAIPWRGKPADQCPDGPRYKALGNSWAVPVARWIGQRIEQVESLEIS